MDGSLAVGLANSITLTDGGIVLVLIGLAMWLAHHIRSDRLDRRRHYELLEAMEQRIEDKIENVRRELRADHKELAGKVDELAKDVAVLNGYHRHEQQNK